jgi:hypothetical protein
MSKVEIKKLTAEQLLEKNLTGVHYYVVSANGESSDTIYTEEAAGAEAKKQNDELAEKIRAPFTRTPEQTKKAQDAFANKISANNSDNYSF